MERLGVYIHWPYCRSKCPYCGFYSRVEKNVNQAEIVDGYLRELEFYHQMSADKKVDTIFFGGGTPSLLEPKQIARIIDKISALWHCADKMEISLEANPNTGYAGWMQDLATAGINRLSLGVQSLTEKNLRFLGRTHSLGQALAAVEEMQKVFADCSIDLMYGLPGQSVTDWGQELQQAFGLGLKHYSLYQLTIEENTVFARRRVPAAEEETAVEMFALCAELAAAAGIQRYEISNYAEPGKECRHNLGYWHGDDYVGIGKGAAGRLRCGGKIYETSHLCQCAVLSAEERAEELLIAGLRASEGIDKARFFNRCGLALDTLINPNALRQLKEENLLRDTPENLQATQAGQLLLDYIVSALYL